MPSAIDPDRLCIILVATRNPLNIGAVARAMCNFGLRHLRLVHPVRSCISRGSLRCRSFLRTRRGQSFFHGCRSRCRLHPCRRHHRHRPSPTATPSPCLERWRFFHPARTRRTSRTIPRASQFCLAPKKLAYRIEDLSHCNWLMHIPTGEEQPSMNLGQAVAVCLYELARNTPPPLPVTDNSACFFGGS